MESWNGNNSHILYIQMILLRFVKNSISILSKCKEENNRLAYSKIIIYDLLTSKIEKIIIKSRVIQNAINLV